MKIRSFITHKLAEEYQDCQDRYSINVEKKTVAVSDGMSQSIFPHYWAELLVESFVNKIDWVPNTAATNELSSEWRKRVNERIEEMRKLGKQTWRVENNLAEGKSACATFLGIRFDRNLWSGDVLGDSCLLTIDSNNRITNIFTSQEGTFDNYPDYFDSNPKLKGKGKPKEITGSLNEGEKLLLVSDPFTGYLAKKKNEENHSGLIEELLRLEDHEQFCTLVNKWREQGMHNDDSTLVIIEYDGNFDFTSSHQDNLLLLIESEQKKTEEFKNQTLTENPEVELKDNPINSITEETSIISPKVESDKDNFQELFHQLNDLLLQIKSGLIGYSQKELKEIKKSLPDLLNNAKHLINRLK